MLVLLTVVGTWVFCSISIVTCKENAVQLSVYYETLCPDSVTFFRMQLNRTYERIGPAFIVDFVPYGLAVQEKVNGAWFFRCQHGKRECTGNKLHACLLAQNNEQEKDVKFLDCSMSSYDPSSYAEMENCARNVGVDFGPVDECFKNGQADELLAKYGERTAAVVPRIKYVPTIIINGVYSQAVQDKAEFDLLRTICEYLEPKPAGCPTTSHPFF